MQARVREVHSDSMQPVAAESEVVSFQVVTFAQTFFWPLLEQRGVSLHKVAMLETTQALLLAHMPLDRLCR